MLRLCCLARALPASSPLGRLQGQLLEWGVLLCLIGFLQLRGCRQGQTAVSICTSQVDGLCGRCRSCNLLHADAVDSPPSVGLSWPASRLSAVQHCACIRSAACFHLDPVDTGQWRYHARQVGPTAHSCTFLSTRQQAHHFERTAAHCSNAYCPWTALQCQSR